jgi:hypothetical protein
LGMFKVEVSHLFHIFVPRVRPRELSRKFLIRCWKTPPWLLWALIVTLGRNLEPYR